MTRIGASQAFFNIVAQFNAEKLIRDTRSLNTVMKAVSLDTFEAILKPIDDMILQMDNAIEAVKDFGVEMGNATVEFEKFYGEAENLEQVKDELIAVGESYAFVGTEALAAGSRAAQVANLIGRQNVKLLVEQAAILAEISDLTLEEAQRGIIQLNQQAGILYGEMTRQQLMSLGARQQEALLIENSARALDVLNTVANRSVALEGDLVKTMTNFASGAKLAGDSFEFMAAASATLLEAGEEQGTAGRALRMMYARLGGDINGARSKIEALGFQFTDSEGQMKSMQGILEDLHNKGWSQLNPAMKQNIAQTIAGNRHYVRFIKLMENYERVTQLTADAQLRLDSASAQATKALESEVRQLQTAEARVQNLKAAIGEGLTPFITSATIAQGDFLEVTEAITDGLGGLGKVLGRGLGFFRVTEGFIKFGLGLQSVGIGLDMFSSVQRSLMGVEIAMANLHSKQAAFLEYGQTATREQKNLMQGQLYIQQNINRANKEIQLAKMVMVRDEQILKQNAETRLRLEEQIRDRANELLINEHELITTHQYENELLAAGDGIYAKRAARINYENQMGRELLETQKQIYAQKMGAEDAYMRQMLADFNVFGSFNEEEKRQLHEKNERLREQHTILQQIKAENEAMRVLRYHEEGQGTQTHRVAGLKLSERERDLLNETIAGEIKKASIMASRLQQMDKRNDYEEDLLRNVQRQIGQFGRLAASLQANTDAVDINDEAFKGLMAIMKSINGEFMQTERAVRTVAAAEKDLVQMSNRLNVVNSIKANLLKNQKLDKEQLAQLELYDLGLKQKLEPLLNVINNAEADRIKQAEKMAEVITILTTAQKDMNKEMEKRQSELSKEYQQSDRFIKDQERARMAYKSMSMGITSLSSILAGFHKNTVLGAAMSMGFMTTQIASASLAVTKSGIEFAKVQHKIFATQMGITGAATATEKWTLRLMTLTRLLGPVAAVGGLLYFFAKHQEGVNKRLEEGREIVDSMNSSLSRFTQGQTLFGQDEGLAKTLDISNYSLEELLANTELTNQVYGQLSNHGKDFSDNIQASVDDALDLLEIVRSIQGTSESAVSQAEFETLLGNMEATLTDRFGPEVFERTLSSLYYGPKADKALKDFMESAGASLETGVFDATRGQQLNAVLADMFENGTSLTEEQIDLLSVALKDDLLQAVLQVNDALVLSADDAEVLSNRVAGGAKSTIEPLQTMVSEIENLTNEIYNFSGAREELFFGGKFGNVTGSLYKQVVTQGVGTLYHKNEIIMSNNFHGFFNEQEAANKIIAVLDQYIAQQSGG